MRFRPANISLINRRHYLPRLRLTLSSKYQNKNNLTHVRALTGHTISTSELPTIRPELRRTSTARLNEHVALFSPFERGYQPAFRDPDDRAAIRSTLRRN